MVCLLDGEPVCIYDPLPGCTHDAEAFATTPGAEIIRNSGAGGSATKIVEDVASSLREKRDPVENSVKATKKATLSSRVNGLREPAERVIAHFKSWRIFHTGYRRPDRTYRETYDAARGLFFFSNTPGFE